MDTELVTDSVSDTGGVGGGGSAPIILRYSDYFEKYCSYYMAIGMSYAEFWDGEVDAAIQYRRAYDNIQDRKNAEMWLQAKYIYEALIAVSPMFNPLSSKKEPYPFLEEPYPLDEETAEEQRKKKERREMEKQRERFKAQVDNFNKQFMKGSELNG